MQCRSCSQCDYRSLVTEKRRRWRCIRKTAWGYDSVKRRNASCISITRMQCKTADTKVRKRDLVRDEGKPARRDRRTPEIKPPEASKISAKIPEDSCGASAAPLLASGQAARPLRAAPSYARAGKARQERSPCNIKASSTFGVALGEVPSVLEQLSLKAPF